MSSDSAGGSVGRRVPLDSAINEFERFLLVSKGVSVVTRECYVRHVRAMLAEVRGATGAVDFGSLSAGWVRSYVTQLGGRYAPQSVKLMATAVREFLRYAWLSGWTASDLTGAVGPVITRRSGRLPRALAAEDLHRLLASPDRRTMVGLRDYALLMLLSRLGLRAGEVAGLRLDDFDWPAALVTAKVKGGGRLRLPIPADVGHARRGVSAATSGGRNLPGAVRAGAGRAGADDQPRGDAGRGPARRPRRARGRAGPPAEALGCPGRIGRWRKSVGGW